MSDDFQDSMMEIFVFETNKFLSTLEEILIQSEENGESVKNATPEIFRIMHTIKSSSAMMSLDHISKLAHKLEDLFFFIRENNPEQIDNARLTDLVLEGVDFIKTNMDGSVKDDPAEKIAGIELFLKVLKGEADPSASTEKPAESSTPKSDTTPTAKTDNAPMEFTVFFKADCRMLGLRAFEIQNKLKKASTHLFTDPEDVSAGEDTIKQKGLSVIMEGDAPFTDIRALILKSPFVERIQTGESKKASLPPPEKFAPQPTPQPVGDPEQPSFNDRRQDQKQDRRQSESAYANVEISKLDYLVDTMGEILVAHMELARAIEQQDCEKSTLTSEAMKKLVLNMQEAALSTRMVPLKETFLKMNRIVRDMCRKQHKEISFITEGEDTEVDRNIVNHLSPPLMHIIRNCVDHGIEPEEERLAAGKPAKGIVTLSAQAEGRNVVITISDDGKGFDTQKILAKAVSSGLITKERAASMTEEDINALVFLPGFSTSKEVTEYSGRGVGMDVVNENMKIMNGKVIVRSRAGQGTKIILRIPLTMALIEALILKVGEETCAVPISSICEIFRVPAGDDSIRKVNGEDVILFRNECYKIINLFDFYAFAEQLSYSDGVMIAVKDDLKKFVLFAGEMDDRQDIVVKPAPAIFSRIRGISGCTILGDGKVSLIIDPSELKDR